MALRTGLNRLPAYQVQWRTLALAIALTAMAVCVGAGVALGQEFVPVKWFVYLCVAPTAVVATLLVRNVKLFLLFLLVLAIPLRLDFRVYAPDASGHLNGIYLSLSDICANCLLLLWLPRLAAKKHGALNWSSRTMLPLLALVLAVVLSSATAFSRTWSAYMIVYLMKLAFLHFIVANSIETMEEARAVVCFFLVALVTASLFIFCSTLLRMDFSLAGSTRALQDFHLVGQRVRPSGTFGNPLIAGGYLAPMLVFALAGLTLKRSLPFSMLCAASAVAGLWALGLTMCRAGYIGSVFGVLVVGLIGLRHRLLTGGTILAVAVIFGLIAIVAGPVVWERIFADDEGSAMGRIPLMKQALLIILDHPITGVGANAYEVVMWRYRPASLGTFWQWKVHNEYMLRGAEFGLVGLAAFIWMLYAYGREAGRCLKANDAFAKVLGVGALGFLSVNLLMMLSDNGFLLHPSGQTAAVLFGLLAGVNWQLTLRADNADPTALDHPRTTHESGDLAPTSSKG
jgi:O-antigen ligase